MGLLEQFRARIFECKNRIVIEPAYFVHRIWVGKNEQFVLEHLCFFMNHCGRGQWSDYKFNDKCDLFS